MGTARRAFDALARWLDRRLEGRTRIVSGVTAALLVAALVLLTLDGLVPSMILQPLVENSIRHGIAPKVGGGRIVLRSRRERGRTIIEVEDNGLGMTDERLDYVFRGTGENGGGIGLRNVGERLRVIYGDLAGIQLTSEPGRGTVARLEIPDLGSVAGGAS